MILVIGEILFDIFPEYKRMGGAPFNFASHMKSFGFPVIFASRTGKDENGRQILEEIEKQGFDLKYVQQDDSYETGHVRVKLDRQGVPDFDIVADVAYDHIAYSGEIVKAIEQNPGLVYYGTLIQRTFSGADTISKIFENIPDETVRFCDINLRPKCYSKSVIETSLTHCDILKLNHDEFEIISDMFEYKRDETAAAEQFMERFNIEWISLTKGAGQSTLYTRQGKYSAGSGQVAHMADTVGAGDAYAAVLAAGYLLSWPPEQILSRAARFAAAICGITGAIPDNRAFYRDFAGWTNGGERDR